MSLSRPVFRSISAGRVRNREAYRQRNHRHAAQRYRRTIHEHPSLGTAVEREHATPSPNCYGSDPVWCGVLPMQPRRNSFCTIGYRFRIPFDPIQFLKFLPTCETSQRSGFRLRSQGVVGVSGAAVKWISSILLPASRCSTDALERSATPGKYTGAAGSDGA